MTFNFNAPVGQVIAGDQTVTGDNIGTQNNYYGTDDPNTQELANELIEILQGIVPPNLRSHQRSRQRNHHRRRNGRDRKQTNP